MRGEEITRTNCILALVLNAMFFALCTSAAAQQPKKVSRIGYLGGASLSANQARVDAFQQRLRELGYVEGKNIIIEWRWAEGKPDRLPELAAELVRLNVDLIISAGPVVTRRLQEATKTIPIVMAQDNDPVGNGFVAGLARPGGNITGLASLAPELSGKQLELMQEIIPMLSRVAVLGSSTEPGNAQTLREIELAAGALKVKIEFLNVLGAKDFETAFQAAKKVRAQAALVLVSSIFNSNRAQLIDLAIRSQLPAVFYTAEYAELGGLIAYGTSYTDLYRRTATYVDKILKGALQIFRWNRRGSLSWSSI